MAVVLDPVQLSRVQAQMAALATHSAHFQMHMAKTAAELQLLTSEAEAEERKLKAVMFNSQVAVAARDNVLNGVDNQARDAWMDQLLKGLNEGIDVVVAPNGSVSINLTGQAAQVFNSNHATLVQQARQLGYSVQPNPAGTGYHSVPLVDAVYAEQQQARLFPAQAPQAASLNPRAPLTDSITLTVNANGRRQEHQLDSVLFLTIMLTNQARPEPRGRRSESEWWLLTQSIGARVLAASPSLLERALHNTHDPRVLSRCRNIIDENLSEARTMWHGQRINSRR